MASLNRPGCYHNVVSIMLMMRESSEAATAVICHDRRTDRARSRATNGVSFVDRSSVHRFVLTLALAVGSAVALNSCAAPAPHEVVDAAPRSGSGVVHLGDLVVDRSERSVSVRGVVAIREGWLEQAVCTRGTRDHESLVVVDARPSAIHAALLLVAAVPGAPGRWSVRSDGRLDLAPPHGTVIDVRVSWRDGAGAARSAPISDWIRASSPSAAPTFVFAGSAPLTRGPIPYAADASGSVVGLVTFGDELIANSVVVPDQAEVTEPSMQACTEAMPTEGTPVTVIFRPR